MLRSTRSIVVAGAAGLLAVGLAGPATAVPVTTTATSTPTTSATAGTERVAANVVPKITWRSCGSDEELAAFQCATVKVPTDYDEPYGAKTSIALTRLPAADPGKRVGTLFTNPGGPGGSGVDFVQSAAPLVYSSDVLDRFDILGFDPRGVARSDPATCWATEAEEQAALASFPAYPLTRAEVPAYQAADKKFARQCAATSPDRFRHISTANVARDMDLLRRAVGDEKLTYAGYSYGTFLGATYAKLFPTRIRALVLDGTLDPREYSGTGPRLRDVPAGNRIEQDRGGAETFAEFNRLCQVAGADRCSLAALGRPAEVSRAVFDGLKKSPVDVALPDGTTLTVSYQLAVSQIYSGLYSPVSWSGIADFLTTVATLQSGTEQKVAATKAVSRDVAALLRGGEDYPSVGGSLGSTCVDTTTPAPRVFPVAADRADERFPDFGRYRTWVGEPCHYLEQQGIVDRDAYRGPWRQTTSSPVLVLGTRHDPATPYKNTKPYAGLFPKASTVTLEGWGHTTLAQSTCVDQRVTSYLLDPATRPVDATCATDLVPFRTPTTAAQQRASHGQEALAAVR